MKESPFSMYKLVMGFYSGEFMNGRNFVGAVEGLFLGEPYFF